MSQRVRFLHLGDIHIQDSRRDEYNEVFRKLIDILKVDASAGIPTLIVVCGDVFDSKTRASPNNMADVQNFLAMLMTVAPIVMIPGNHDLNMNRPGQLDLLTPTINECKNLTDLTYWRESGVYHLNVDKYPQFANITFVVSAPDGEIPQRNISAAQLRRPGTFLVGLMHEEVNGATAFGWKFSGTRFDGTRVTKTDLEGFDVVMLGHIHERQLMAANAGYCGSLIQRNFGEPHHSHGYLVWDLTLGHPAAVAARDVPNDHGYLTVKYVDGVDVTKEPRPLKPIAVRVEHIGCEGDVVENLLKSVGDRYGAIRNVRKLATDAVQNAPSVQHNQDAVVKIGEEMASIDIQLALIRQLLLGHARCEDVINMHTIRSTALLTNDPSMVVGRRTRWRLMRIRFSNVFCYGPGNHIDFTLLKGGVSGVIAPNMHGKSALMDTLMYVLYDTMPRGTKANIKNHTYRDAGGAEASSYSASVELELDNVVIKISRFGDAQKHSKVRFVVDGEDKTGGSTTETYKAIAKYIGRYEDAVSTTMALQDDHHDFARMSPDHRKQLLGRMFHVSVFQDLAKTAREEHLDIGRTIKAKEKAFQAVSVGLSPEALAMYEQGLNAITNESLPQAHSIIKALNDELVLLDDATVQRLQTAEPDQNSVALGHDELQELRSLETAPADPAMDILASMPYIEPVDEPSEPCPHQPTCVQPNPIRLKALTDIGTNMSDAPAQKPNINPSMGYDIVALQRELTAYEPPPATDDTNLESLELELSKLQQLKYSGVTTELPPFATPQLRAAAEAHAAAKLKADAEYKQRNASTFIRDAIPTLELVEHCPGCANVRRIAHYGGNADFKTAMTAAASEFSNILEAEIRSRADKVQRAKNAAAKQSRYNAVTFQVAALKIHNAWEMRELHNAQLAYDWMMYDRYLLNQQQRDDLQRRVDTSKANTRQRHNELRLKAAIRRASVVKYIGDYNTYVIALERRSGELNATITATKQRLEQLSELKQELDDARHEEECLRLYRDVLDERKGIPALLLKRNMTAFTSTVNQLLAEFTSMQLDIADDLTVAVRVGSFRVAEPIEMASGYQKFVIALACRVGLARIANAPLMDGLMIDEGFICIDSDNQELAINFLRELGQQHELLFIISHLEAMQGAMERPLLIERKFGPVAHGSPPYSHIQNAPYNEGMDERPTDFVPSPEDPNKFICQFCKTTLSQGSIFKHRTSAGHIKKVREAGYE